MSFITDNFLRENVLIDKRLILMNLYIILLTLCGCFLVLLLSFLKLLYDSWIDQLLHVGGQHVESSYCIGLIDLCPLSFIEEIQPLWSELNLKLVKLKWVPWIWLINDRLSTGKLSEHQILLVIIGNWNDHFGLEIYVELIDDFRVWFSLHYIVCGGQNSCTCRGLYTLYGKHIKLLNKVAQIFL